MNKRILMVSATPTVDTNAYATGDLIGTKMSFELAMALDWGGAILDGIIITDQAKQVANVDLVLFGSDPAGTTFTDNSGFDIADNDQAKVIAAASITTHFSHNDNSLSVARGLGLALPLDPRSSLIYGALVSRATPTFAAATDVTVSLILRAP